MVTVQHFYTPSSGLFEPYSPTEMQLLLWYCYLAIGNKFKEKKVMSSFFLVFFDCIVSVANSRGEENVTETQQNSFLLLRGGIINKHFHLESRKYWYIEVCIHGHSLVLTKHLSFC